MLVTNYKYANRIPKLDFKIELSFSSHWLNKHLNKLNKMCNNGDKYF
jgi:hypothetical protein